MDTLQSGALRVRLQIAVLTLGVLAGCGLVEDTPTEFAHISLDGQLDKFRQDFNARSDQVRLVFIVGPT